MRTNELRIRTDLIWGFMAIYHVNCLFPDLNDLPNLEALRRPRPESALWDA